jgi:hypothetical protein
MADESEDEEEFILFEIPAEAVNRDTIAAAIFEFSADQAAATAKFLAQMALAWAGQAKKSILDTAMHDEITMDIESLPATTEE